MEKPIKDGCHWHDDEDGIWRIRIKLYEDQEHNWTRNTETWTGLVILQATEWPQRYLSKMDASIKQFLL